MQKINFTLLSLLSLLSLLLCSIGIGPLQAAPIFETYTEDWSCFPFPSTCSICSPVCNLYWGGKNLNIAFASFNFPGGGLGGMTETQAQIKAVIDFVHSQGGKVKISFGGATLPYHLENANLWPNVQAIAQNIANIINNNAAYGFDGVDFDIETNPQNPPPGFVDSLIDMLTAVRAGIGPSKLISLTVPAQGWGTWIELVMSRLIESQNAHIVDYFFFMEYDIWVPSGSSYAQQIAQDILVYGTSPGGWQIPFNKIMLGVMPGTDDIGRFLSLTDVIGNGQPNTGLVNTVVLRNGLYGIGMWDLNRDYAGQGGQSSLAYTNAIVQNLARGPNLVQYTAKTAAPIAKRPYSSDTIEVQAVPPHGPP